MTTRAISPTGLKSSKRQALRHPGRVLRAEGPRLPGRVAAAAQRGDRRIGGALEVTYWSDAWVTVSSFDVNCDLHAQSLSSRSNRINTGVISLSAGLLFSFANVYKWLVQL